MKKLRIIFSILIVAVLLFGTISPLKTQAIEIIDDQIGVPFLEQGEWPAFNCLWIFSEGENVDVYNTLAEIYWITWLHELYLLEIDPYGTTYGSAVYLYFDKDVRPGMKYTTPNFWQVPEKYRQAFLACFLAASTGANSIEGNLKIMKKKLEPDLYDEIITNYWRDDYVFDFPTRDEIKKMPLFYERGTTDEGYMIERHFSDGQGYIRKNQVNSLAAIYDYFTATCDVFKLMTGYTPSTVTHIGRKLQKRYPAVYVPSEDTFYRANTAVNIQMYDYPNESFYRFLKDFNFKNYDVIFNQVAQFAEIGVFGEWAHEMGSKYGVPYGGGGGWGTRFYDYESELWWSPDEELPKNPTKFFTWFYIYLVLWDVTDGSNDSAAFPDEFKKYIDKDITPEKYPICQYYIDYTPQIGNAYKAICSNSSSKTPTAVPTSEPTASPTKEPTPVPTTAPTLTVTPVPTTSPEPTKEPNVTPAVTDAPTDTPVVTPVEGDGNEGDNGSITGTENGETGNDVTGTENGGNGETGNDNGESGSVSGDGSDTENTEVTPAEDPNKPVPSPTPEPVFDENGDLVQEGPSSATYEVEVIENTPTEAAIGQQGPISAEYETEKEDKTTRDYNSKSESSGINDIVKFLPIVGIIIVLGVVFVIVMLKRKRR